VPVKVTVVDAAVVQLLLIINVVDWSTPVPVLINTLGKDAPRYADPALALKLMQTV